MAAKSTDGAMVQQRQYVPGQPARAFQPVYAGDPAVDPGEGPGDLSLDEFDAMETNQGGLGKDATEEDSPGASMDETWDGPDDSHPAESEEAVDSGSFRVPAGYRLIPEDLYRHLMTLLLSGAAKTETVVSSDGPVVRLEVLADCTIGDCNEKLRAGTTLEWAPNQWIKYGGKKHDRLNSFLTYFNRQNPCHVQYNALFPPKFRVLNPEALEGVFPGITARLRGEPAGATPQVLGKQPGVYDPTSDGLGGPQQAPAWMGRGVVRGGTAPAVASPQPAPVQPMSRQQLPPIGSPERRAHFANINPFGTNRPAPAIPGMTANSGPQTVEAFRTARAAQPLQRTAVREVGGKPANELLGAHLPPGMMNLPGMPRMG